MLDYRCAWCVQLHLCVPLQVDMVCPAVMIIFVGCFFVFFESVSLYVALVSIEHDMLTRLALTHRELLKVCATPCDCNEEISQSLLYYKLLECICLLDVLTNTKLHHGSKNGSPKSTLVEQKRPW